ncbi:MAG: phosphatidylserine decarboxylase family protein [Flavobacteriia bacterium]|nr:phosphatidylserine decarboxylase family protein [Flavobacteriia bacterium]
MKIHKEGTTIIIITLLIVLSLHLLNEYLFNKLNIYILYIILLFLELFIFILVLQFFRVPKRIVYPKENEIRCPADGKVVVIEEVLEEEFFHDKRIQISIFMSPLNVHANYHPISGIIQYVKYHKGKYLVAWHPKSSTENERTTIVTKHQNGKSILFRQIAGAVARRICFYVKDQQEVSSATEFGFIKFGSRIDVFLPLDTKVNVKIGDKVKGKIDVLATF